MSLVSVVEVSMKLWRRKSSRFSQKLEFFITVFCPFHLKDDLFLNSFSNESEFYACSTFSKPNLNF